MTEPRTRTPSPMAILVVKGRKGKSIRCKHWRVCQVVREERDKKQKRSSPHDLVKSIEGPQYMLGE